MNNIKQEIISYRLAIKVNNDKLLMIIWPFYEKARSKTKRNYIY